jgi:uncharacterized protein (DUF983 family)
MGPYWPGKQTDFTMTTQDPVLTPSEQPPERPLWTAVGRGWKRRCPCCGQGEIFAGYISVRHDCEICQTPLHHQRADDGPAYLTILIVGKVMTALMYAAFIAWRPDPVVLATGFCIGSLAMALYLLPRLKGGLIGVQWAKRMHGFGIAPQ